MKTYCSIGLLVLAACVSAGSVPDRIFPQPCPSGGLGIPPQAVGAPQPAPRHMAVPPMPIPTSLFGQTLTIRMVIDTAGHVLTDSVTVCGVHDTEYASRLATTYAKLPFTPAETPEGPLQSAYYLRIQLPERVR